MLAWLLLLSSPVSAASVSASWDPVTLDVDGRPESISHYMLYYGQTPRPAGVTHPGDGTFGYDHAVNVGNATRAQRADLTGGRTYYFAVAAVDTGGNLSAYSDEVRLEVPADEDGGSTDAGGPDGGTPDAGPADEGGQPSDFAGKVEGGCGCGRSAPASAGMPVLFFLWLMTAPWLRRGRRSSG